MGDLPTDRAAGLQPAPSRADPEPVPLRRALVPGLCAGLLLLAAPPALADPLGTAQERAAGLRAAVVDLERRTDTAVEQYDTAQDDLAAGVAARVQAERDLEVALDGDAAAAGVRNARIRTLYAMGGPAALYGSVLRAGSPTEALQGVRTAQRLLGLDAGTAVGVWWWGPTAESREGCCTSFSPRRAFQSLMR